MRRWLADKLHLRYRPRSVLRRDPAASLKAIREEIGDCHRCGLCQSRTQIVFGAGDPHARLLFVGEGPAADEDRQGEPFVGRAGQLLTDIITKGMGLRREDVYLANVLKCRPPENRMPLPDETSTCLPFLEAQIAAIHPEVIVALGATACQSLLGVQIQLSKYRGTWSSWKGIPLMSTFHPSYLLRIPAAKHDMWYDIQQVLARMSLPVHGKLPAQHCTAVDQGWAPWRSVIRMKPLRLIVSLIPQAIAVSMLLFALSPKNPYSYYVILRIVVFSCGAYLLYRAFQLGRTALSWLLIVAVLLYNPFFRVHLTRPAWFVINLLTIALFVSVTVFCNVGRGKPRGVAEERERETREPDERVLKQCQERIAILEKEKEQLEKQREWFSSMIDPL